MVEVTGFLLLALLLLVLGVIGSVVPAMPGVLLSVIGVVVYWWSTSYNTPSTLFVAATVIVGLATFMVNYFAGAVAAKAGGASNFTTLAAAVVSVILFFFLGPLGIIVGVAGTVFVIEFVRTERAEDSMRTALITTTGIIGSTVIQLVITISILVAFLIVIL